MSNPQTLVSSQLPAHFKEYFPKFILFMEKYYEWLYRHGGLTEQEVANLKENQSKWISTDLDRYNLTGETRFLGVTSDRDVHKALVEMNQKPTPGAEADQIHSEYLFERTFDIFETLDDYVFETSDEHVFESAIVNPDFLLSWYQAFGFFLPTDDTSLGRFDSVLLMRLLKHIYAIKGTKKSIEIFFSMFFGEVNIEVFLPKTSIAILDNNFVLEDPNSVLRDDYYYNEYSYVIRVDKDPEYYKEVFENIYLKYLHPSGFKVFLEKKV